MIEKENLLGVLIKSGTDSRRKLAAAIMEGRVTVNGVEANGLRQPVDSRKDRILVDGKEIRLVREKLVYLILNKPPDVLSTVTDDRGRKTVTDIIPEIYRQYRLYPAGRLDIDTTGLLLLTNDGELTNKLTHPRYEHEKEYLAVLDKALTPDEIKKLEDGIELYDGKTSPAKVARTDDSKIIGYSIVIHEGKKHQVKRMFMSLGRRVLRLKRIRLGKLVLGNLKEGEVREISSIEVKRAFGLT
jgi:23S rRNA pseudouridine2605 synthase